MRMHNGVAIVLGGIAAVAGLWAHQGLSQAKSGDKVLAVLSTTDVIGYTSPCG